MLYESASLSGFKHTSVFLRVAGGFGVGADMDFMAGFEMLDDRCHLAPCLVPAEETTFIHLVIA